MLIKNVLLILSIFTGILQAQFSKSLEISSVYDDNLFRTPQAENDMVTDVMLGLNYHPLESNFNFQYSTDFLLYQDNVVRNFSLHEIGVNYSVPFDTEKVHNLYMGADYTLRVNGDDYSYYDYNQFYAYANMRLDLEWLFLSAGYNYRYRSYSNLEELSNNQHFVFAQINKSFVTHTTIIIETDLGQKSFSGQRTYSTTITDGDGHRRGGRYSDTAVSQTSSEDMPSLNQAVFLARISQSLDDKIGIYLQYRRQFSLTAKTSFMNADDYYQDEELFDDPFSYESEGYSSQLTWILPWSMKMQLGGNMLSKNYISEQAFTSALDSIGQGGTRMDDRSSFYLNISKVLNLNKPWIESLHFDVHYNYIRSESNSYWYNYRNNVYGGGIQWNF